MPIGNNPISLGNVLFEFVPSIRPTSLGGAYGAVSGQSWVPAVGSRNLGSWANKSQPAITNVSVGSTTANSATINFNINLGGLNSVSVRLQYEQVVGGDANTSVFNGSPGEVLTSATVYTNGTGTKSITVSGLTAGATYHYRLLAYNAFNDTANITDWIETSGYRTFTTVNPVLDAPILSYAFLQDFGNIVSIGWTDNNSSSEVDSYRLELTYNGSIETIVVPWSGGSKTANVTSSQFFSDPPSATGSARLRAIGKPGYTDSPWSDTITAEIF